MRVVIRDGPAHVPNKLADVELHFDDETDGLLRGWMLRGFDIWVDQATGNPRIMPPRKRFEGRDSRMRAYWLFSPIQREVPPGLYEVILTEYAVHTQRTGDGNTRDVATATTER